MPLWQRLIKRLLDITISLAGLVLLSPLMLYVAIRIRLSSVGPVFYSQERVGYHGKKFFMKKFRSMYIDAEKHGPRLSANNDERITSWGRVMRRWKLDEIPQLWNVLVGEMSIVGPRPEREHYIRELEKQNQSFGRLLEVKPGITSLGMIRFGYAGSIAEMKERIRYDLEYVQNMSLALDMKIMVQTLRIILMAKDR